MSEINLQSVLDRLLKEDHDQASEILHQWFIEKCAKINKGLLGEEVHVHVHQGDDHVAETGGDDDENDDDGMGENLSPISGNQDMDVDGDSDSSTFDSEDDGEMSPESDIDQSEDPDLDPDMNGEDGEPEDLEGRVDQLEDEYAEIKAQIAELLGNDSDVEADDDSEADAEVDGSEEDNDSDSDSNPFASADDDEGGDEDELDDSDSEDDDSEKEDDKKDDDFDDLEESFELERVRDPMLDGSRTIGSGSEKFTKNDKSLIPGNSNVNNRVAGEPVEIRSDNYTKNGLEPSPAVKQTPIRKNQVKNAESNLEKVDSMGPKNALLNRKGDGYGTDVNDKSLIGSKGSVGNNKGFK